MVNHRAARNGGNRENVQYGSPNCVTGAIFRAPVGTPFPQDNMKPESPWLPQGACGKSGVVFSHNKAYATEEGWCGDPIAKKRTTNGVKAKFELVESRNATVARTLFGDDVVNKSNGGFEVGYSGDDPEPSAWLIYLKDGDKLRVIKIPDAELTNESWDWSLVSDALIKYPVELTLYKDEDGKFYYDDVIGNQVPEPTDPEQSRVQRPNGGAVNSAAGKGEVVAQEVIRG